MKNKLNNCTLTSRMNRLMSPFDVNTQMTSTVSIKGVRFQNCVRGRGATRRRNIFITLVYSAKKKLILRVSSLTFYDSMHVFVCFVSMFYLNNILLLQMQKCIGGVCASLIFCALLTETIGMVIAVRLVFLMQINQCLHSDTFQILKHKHALFTKR